MKKYLKKSKYHHTKFKINNLEIGGKGILIVAGPCAINTEESFNETAKRLKNLGVNAIRGGAYKPRTSPYSFQGLGERGIKILNKVARKYNFITVTEVLSIEDISLIEKYCDIIQVGSRSMYNYPLLKALGKSKTPILLKRGMSATYKDWLYAAEYILSGGNHKIILCERGIRSFGKETRNVLDIVAVDYLKRKTHLPVFVDPSHATGKRELVFSASMAAIASGCDGLLIEASYSPAQEISDSRQTISLNTLKKIIYKGNKIASAFDRHLV